ncbi:MAG: adenylyl-sulfate kinase [Muribaculaceae bacterium]|nr:adenylyl-sulfate kinase [Muribaculaceae bacterium]
MNKGILYWLTGLSGAGKTTIGNRLYYSMKSQKQNTVILDGDILKKIAGKDLGYNREERLERAYRYCSLCKLLTDQGINVIICTIAMFDEIREWNRDNIENYVEVFVDVEMEVLKLRNRKGLYSRVNGNIAGVDVEIEYPKNPDIVIKNNVSQSLEENVQRILKYEVVPRKRWNRDEDYWNNYYSNRGADSESKSTPSLFACAMLQKYMKSGEYLVEFGCGNGRDSLYFAKNGLNVTGIDASQIAIKKLQEEILLDNCLFICDDFVSAEAIYQIQYDYCYSRFTLHAINEQQETQILKKAYDMLKEKGYLFIEARSVNDKKCGAGLKVERNAFISDGHYRRFIVLSELVSKLENIGFVIIESAESDKFAPSSGDNAVCVRIEAQKI